MRGCSLGGGGRGRRGRGGGWGGGGGVGIDRGSNREHSRHDYNLTY